MGAVKNAFHDEICNRADAKALHEDGYSDKEIAVLRDSDGSPKGGDGEAGSVHDSAAIARKGHSDDH